MRLSAFSGLFLGLALGACSTPVIVSVPAHPGAEGLAYALPKAQAEVQAQRFLVSQGDIDKATKRVAAAKQAKEAADAAAKIAQQQESSSKADAKASASGIAKDLLGLKAATAAARLVARKAEAEKAVQELQSAESWLEQLEAHPNACMLSVSAKLLDIVPDRKARYVAQHKDGFLRDDHYVLKISNGMLGSASSEAQGQLGDALVSIASMAGALTQAKSSWLRTVPMQDSRACAPAQFHQLFDPSLGTEWLLARQKLHDFDPGLQLTVRVAGEPHQSERSDRDAVTTPSATGLAESNSTLNGLAYRAAVGVSITVTVQAEPKPSLVQIGGVVPDATTLGVLPVMGDVLTRRNTGYEFVNGMPTALDASRPSRIAAALRIPVDMAKAFLEIPASLIKLRVDLASQQNNLSEQEVLALKKQLALLEAEQALKKGQDAVDP